MELTICHAYKHLFPSFKAHMTRVISSSVHGCGFSPQKANDLLEGLPYGERCWLLKLKEQYCKILLDFDVQFDSSHSISLCVFTYVWCKAYATDEIAPIPQWNEVKFVRLIFISNNRSESNL